MSEALATSPDLLRLSGGPLQRGLAQAGQSSPGTATATARAIRLALSEADGAGLLDVAARDYLAAQFAFHRTEGPAITAEIEGIARGFSLPAEDLLAFHHLGLLEVLKVNRAPSQDGCSAWAVSEGPDGPLLVKNRDSASVPDRPQRVAAHRGPDIEGGAMICVGTLGSPGAYSSGMNAYGLAVADTHVRAADVSVGWLRLFLATHLLTHCTTVAEALSYIEQVPHAGGGTLVMVDRGGAVAAVDFDAAGSSVSRDACLWRTNHFTRPAPRCGMQATGSESIEANSLARFAHLAHSLSAGTWDVAHAMDLMATHDAAPLCQHRLPDNAETLSTAIYACRTGTLTFSDTHPCNGKWSRYDIESWTSLPVSLNLNT